MTGLRRVATKAPMYRRAPTPHEPLASQRATTSRERGDADERRNLLAVEGIRAPARFGEYWRARQGSNLQPPKTFVAARVLVWDTGDLGRPSRRARQGSERTASSEDLESRIADLLVKLRMKMAQETACPHD